MNGGAALSRWLLSRSLRAISALREVPKLSRSFRLRGHRGGGPAAACPAWQKRRWTGRFRFVRKSTMTQEQAEESR